MNIIKHILNAFREERAAKPAPTTVEVRAPDPLDARVDLIISVLERETGHNYEPGRDAIVAAMRKHKDEGHVTCSFNLLGLGVELPYLDIIEARAYERYAPGYAMLEDIYPENAIRAGDVYVWSNGPRLARDNTPALPG